MEEMEKSNVIYVCDQRRCKQCSDECSHTTELQYAKNFTKVGDVYIEEFGGMKKIDESKVLVMPIETARQVYMVEQEIIQIRKNREINCQGCMGASFGDCEECRRIHMSDCTWR